MSDNWMPTTAQVREAYSIDPEDEYRDPINAPANQRANERYFDRWLADHDREVAARTVEAAIEYLMRWAGSQKHSTHIGYLQDLAAKYRVADQNGGE